ncbi:MAG: hypothetical protein LBH87_03150 [Coriobacteriales bacterium]|jgi:hypothetical protein|nr:hypothetical protein [Coriobacteriales bacterium]
MNISELTTTTVNKSYRDIPKRRLFYYCFIVLFGIIALALYFIASNPQIVASLNDAGIPIRLLKGFMQGYYLGFGGGFTASGIIIIIWVLVQLFGKKRQAERAIREFDERNRMIRSRSIVLTTSIMISLSAIAIIIAGVFNMTVMFTLITGIIVFLVVYVICHLALRARS